MLTNEYPPFYQVQKSTSKIVVQKGRRANADEGWRGGEGGSVKCWPLLTRGGRGVYEPPILADVICEQLLVGVRSTLTWINFGPSFYLPKLDSFRSLYSWALLKTNLLDEMATNVCLLLFQLKSVHGEIRIPHATCHCCGNNDFSLIIADCISTMKLSNYFVPIFCMHHVHFARRVTRTECRRHEV